MLHERGGETSTGRLEKDPTEEEAVRTVLKRAAAAKRCALATAGTDAQGYLQHPGNDSNSAVAAAADTAAPDGAGASAVDPSIHFAGASPISTTTAGGDADEATKSMLSSPLPPPPVSSPPSQLSQNRVLAPPLPPPVPLKPTPASSTTAAAATAASNTATSRDPPTALPQPPTQVTGVHIQTPATTTTCGYEVKSVVAVPTARAGPAAATGTQTAEGFACGTILEGEYELEKVRS